MVLLAYQEERALTGPEEDKLRRHLDACDECAMLAGDPQQAATLPAATAHTAPAAGFARTEPSADPDAPAPKKIGRFLVLESLGAGGMGKVFAAYDPYLDRKVAIKLLHPQVWQKRTSAGRQRLLREARALAKLSHPNVIAVHDLGRLGDQAFVAMEFAAKGTLRQWLAEDQRSWREVLDVFLEAGRGLAAAHAIGLVHRDFKPDNVLLTEDGRVCVADFGLVSVTDTDDEDKGEYQSDDAIFTGSGDDDGDSAEKRTRRRQPSWISQPGEPTSNDDGITAKLTETGLFMGTPAYMAPEQHRAEEVDARADQYSFCVALYEALYGELPFDPKSRFELAFDIGGHQMRDAPAGSDVPAWIREILQRGLAEKTAERYPSMDALLGELASDPVEAARRRRKTFAIAAAFVALATLAVIGITRSGEREALCQRADEKLAGVWDTARRGAIERAFAATGRPYAADVFSRVAARLDDYAAAWVTARTEACEATHVLGEQSEAALDLRMRCLDRRSSQLAALVDVLAGEADAEVVDKAVLATAELVPIAACGDIEALESALPLPDDPARRAEIEKTQRRLDEAATQKHAGQYDAGLTNAKQVAEDARALGFGPLHAEALSVVAGLLAAKGRYDQAKAVYYDGLRAAAEARHHELVAEIWTHLIVVTGVMQRRAKDAMALRMPAEIALAQAAGDNRLRADLSRSLGAMSWVQGNYDEARSHYERALQRYRSAVGDEHPHIASTLSNLGLVLKAQGHHAEARATYERSIATYERTLGPAHPDVARPLNNLGVLLSLMGEYDQAEKHHLRALAIYENALGEKHPRLASTLNNLGLVLKARGSYDQAQAYFERSLAIYEDALGAEDPRLASTLNNLGQILELRGNYRAAQRVYERALAIDEKAHGPEHPNVASTLNNLGLVLVDQGKRDEARQHYERALAIKEKALGPEHSGLVNALNNLGEVLSDAKRYDEAQRHFERALAIVETSFGPEHPRAASALTSLGDLYVARNRPIQALPLLMRALAIRESNEVPDEHLAKTRFALSRALWRSGRDRDRAVELATSARDGFLEAGQGARADLAIVNAWLSDPVAR